MSTIFNCWPLTRIIKINVVTGLRVKMKIPLIAKFNIAKANIKNNSKENCSLLVC